MTSVHAFAAVVSAPIRELLVWIAREPRMYEQAMEAWRSSCPRFSVWEDALDAGQFAVEGADRVTLTRRGQSVLRD